MVVVTPNIFQAPLTRLQKHKVAEVMHSLGGGVSDAANVFSIPPDPQDQHLVNQS